MVTSARRRSFGPTRPACWRRAARMAAAASRFRMTRLRAALNHAEIGPKGHLDALHAHGTDVQLISPRPFQLMHSEKPAKLVRWFAEECHNIIHRQTQLYPEPSSSASRACRRLPARRSSEALPELERCVKELGFVGCLLNPDPYENSGAGSCRRSATATGIRSTRSSASSTFRRTSTPRARAPSAPAIRCI